MLLSVVKSQCRQKLCIVNNSANSKAQVTSDYYQNLHYFCQSGVFAHYTLHWKLESLFPSIVNPKILRKNYCWCCTQPCNYPKRFSSLLPFIQVIIDDFHPSFIAFASVTLTASVGKTNFIDSSLP